mmetsp:Transcript_151988/g.487944  ORF Transcript_151988/g.487944 Transcript_151988/m.487944 type:complete len:280 (-) Transcript_151988:2452-3291(-)
MLVCLLQETHALAQNVLDLLADCAGGLAVLVEVMRLGHDDVQQPIEGDDSVSSLGLGLLHLILGAQHLARSTIASLSEEIGLKVEQLLVDLLVQASRGLHCQQGLLEVCAGVLHDCAQPDEAGAIRLRLRSCLRARIDGVHVLLERGILTRQQTWSAQEETRQERRNDVPLPFDQGLPGEHIEGRTSTRALDEDAIKHLDANRTRKVADHLCLRDHAQNVWGHLQEQLHQDFAALQVAQVRDLVGTRQLELHVQPPQDQLASRQPQQVVGDLAILQKLR